MKLKQTLLLAALGTAFAAGAQNAPLWMRDAVISPDGSRIAFTYKGDIYTVPTKGGEARRLTWRESYDMKPVWSPDGTMIAFADDRNGNMDVYVMPAEGGEARRLTSNSASETPLAFTADGKAVIFSAAIQDQAESALYPSARMSELYRVDLNGGNPVQIMGTPAAAMAWLPDGKSFVYEDIKGFEDEWRKHHTSSVSRDIWLYDANTGQHRNLTQRAGEDRNPNLSADGKTMYYLSEPLGGTFNVFTAPVDNPKAARQLTNFAQHPVRFLSRANDGTLAMGYNGELYTLAPGAKEPVKVNVSIQGREGDEPEMVAGSASGAVPSPDGKMVAFTARGDVFVTSVEYGTTRRVTKTPGTESSVAWGKDGRTLYYTSERDGHFNIYKATMGRKDDPNFANATVIDEKPLIAADNIERGYPSLSPDGKTLAFIQDRNKLMAMDVKTGAVRQLTDGSTYQQRDGGFYYEWSPDSRWIALEVIDNKHDPYADIALLNVADGKYVNITQSGYASQRPHFSGDGTMLTFLTERYGMRNHASWGSQQDVMLVFLNRAAQDKFNMSKEDYELYKAAEEKAEKAAKSAAEAKTAKDKKGKKSSKKADSKADDSKSADKPMLVELDGIQDRVVRLTPFSADISDALIPGKSDKLYYAQSVGDDYDIWSMDLRKREPSKAVSLGSASPVGLTPDAKGEMVLVEAGRKLSKLDPKSDKNTPISYSARFLLDRSAERLAMFDQMENQVRERFYRTDMHGVGWKAMCQNYRNFLPHISNNYDYAELLSELLGELNVSHTGGRFYPEGGGDQTARLGLLYDMTHQGDGMLVTEVLKGGPFDKAASKMVAGSTITAVNGTQITPDTDRQALMNRLVGTKTLVEFTTPDGKQLSEVVLPVSAGTENSLLYKRWVKARAADVDRWSNGRLGYVHIPSMADASFRPVYSDVLGKYNDREGIVIDIRWNGGGRMHEDIEVMFSGQKYLTQEIRGVESCDMPSRRWNKPSIMLMAEACYSNAHGTPWVYKHQNLGKLVGAPVPGTMTSVNWVTMQDPSLVYGIPVIGYRTAEGTYLENSQLEPDVLILNDPATVVKGEDTQLRTAVNELLKQLDSK